MSDPITRRTRTRSSLQRIARHFRRQWAGFLALFLVLTTGGAYALAGTNTVFSDDIVSGNVRNSDLAANAVSSAKIVDESLTGDDILETTLNPVPVAAQGGTGRYGFSGQCDPEGSGATRSLFVDCSSVQITLARPGRLLITGTVTASSTAEWALGACRLEVGGDPILASEIEFDWDAEDRGTHSVLPGATTAVSHAYSPGTYVVGIECRENRTAGGDGRISFPVARVTAVSLSGY